MYLLGQDATQATTFVKDIYQIWPFGAILAILLALIVAWQKFFWKPFRQAQLEFKAAEKKLRDEEDEARHKREQESNHLKLQIELAKTNQTEQMTRCSENNVKAAELHARLHEAQTKALELLEPHIQVLRDAQRS